MQRLSRSTRVHIHILDICHNLIVLLHLDRSRGDCIKLSELRQRVKEDPAMQNLSKDEEEELRKEVTDLREQRQLGARPTNAAACQDYRHQLKSLNDQVFSEITFLSP